MPSLKKFATDCSVDEVLAAIETDGACVIENIIGSDTADAIVSEVSPFIDRTRYGEEVFSGARTRRTGALVARSPTTREVILNEHVLSIARGFLLRFADRIQLNLTQTIAIEPGQGAQPLHRDRFGWGDHIPLDIEPQFNSIWALSDFTADNGATQVVPGSHQWPLEREARPDEICQAEMSKGSVLLHSGSVIHAGGENRTDDTRLGLNITYCLGWLRQEENQYLSCPPEIARDLPIELKELLGYTQGNYALGYYSDPGGASGLGAGILEPESAVGARARTEWISTEDGYRSVDRT